VTHSGRLDAIQAGVLDRMERAEKLMKISVIGAAILEAGLFVIALYLVDWKDPVQRLMFIFAVLSYTIIALGLVALGGHVTRTAARILAAMGTSA
jgi:predicted RND superfamily exporter protein